MAVLNAWQRPDRVLPGKVFGDGVDGATTSTTIPSLANQSCSGSASSTTVTLGSADFTNGDMVLLIQMRGTGVGQWEINRISSGGGSTSLTMQEALHYTYTDSGASQARIIKVPRYTTVSPASGTWTLADWDGNAGGVFAMCASISTSFAAAFAGSGKGMVAGTGGFSGSATGRQGEGTSGAGGTQSTSANGSGGGGGTSTTNQCGGGAGGNGTAGQAAGSGGGTSGGTSGAADLTTMTLGGAGGSGGSSNGSAGRVSGAGGDGGGIFIIFSKTITITGSINVNGANGVNCTGGSGGAGGGGGGAGGSVLIACETATLGTGLVTATGGTRGLGNGPENDGDTGGSGRIAIHHSGAVSGTTSPTFEDVSDATMKVAGAAGGPIFFQGGGLAVA